MDILRAGTIPVHFCNLNTILVYKYQIKKGERKRERGKGWEEGKEGEGEGGRVKRKSQGDWRRGSALVVLSSF